MVVIDTLDYLPPTLTCEEGPLEIGNDQGKSTATVSWNFTFTDNSLEVGEPGISEDSFQVVLTIEDAEVNASLSSWLLPIGDSNVKYHVTDAAGNSAFCQFRVEVTGKRY